MFNRFRGEKMKKVVSDGPEKIQTSIKILNTAGWICKQQNHNYMDASSCYLIRYTFYPAVRLNVDPC